MAAYGVYSYYYDETMERYLLLVQKEYVEHVLRIASRFLQEAVRIGDIRLISATIIVPSEQCEVRYATAHDRYLNLNGLSEVFSDDDIYLLRTTNIAMDVELSQHHVDNIIPSVPDHGERAIPDGYLYSDGTCVRHSLLCCYPDLFRRARSGHRLLVSGG
jgi:hypothetical protein